MSLTYNDLSYLGTVGSMTESSLITPTTSLENIDIDRALEKLDELDKRILKLRFGLPNMLRNLANITEGDMASQVFYCAANEAKTLKLEIDTFVNEYGQCKPLFDLINNWKSSLQTENIFDDYGKDANQQDNIGSFDGISDGVDFNNNFNFDQNNNFPASKSALVQMPNIANDNGVSDISLSADNNRTPMNDPNFNNNRQRVPNTPSQAQVPPGQNMFEHTSNNISEGNLRKGFPINNTVNSPNITSSAYNQRNVNTSNPNSNNQINIAHNGLDILDNIEIGSNRVSALPSSNSPHSVDVNTSTGTVNSFGGDNNMIATNNNVMGNSAGKANNINLVGSNYPSTNAKPKDISNNLQNVKDQSTSIANTANTGALKDHQLVANGGEILDNNVSLGQNNGMNTIGGMDFSLNKANNYINADIGNPSINVENPGFSDINSTNLNALGNFNSLNDTLVGNSSIVGDLNPGNTTNINNAIPNNNLNLGVGMSPQQSNQIGQQPPQGVLSDQYNNQQFLNSLRDMSFVGNMTNLDQTIKFNDPSLSFMNL